MSFDPETGLLWGADVGQNAYEEIDIIVKGGNYGWNAREGKHAYRGGEKTEEMIDPVTEYGHDQGVSVTGGCVYRGQKQKALQGIYLYADYATGRLWGLDYDHENKKVRGEELLGHFPRATISSFGVDADNEVYACAHRPGLIYRVVVIDDEDEEDGF
jgi:quinoprotein glucose dehydrogenase